MSHSHAENHVPNFWRAPNQKNIINIYTFFFLLVFLLLFFFCFFAQRWRHFQIFLLTVSKYFYACKIYAHLSKLQIESVFFFAAHQPKSWQIILQVFW